MLQLAKEKLPDPLPVKVANVFPKIPKKDTSKTEHLNSRR